MGNCSSCGGTKYVPGGKPATPPLVYDIEVDGKITGAVTDQDGGLHEALRQVAEHRKAGHQAQAHVQRA